MEATQDQHGESVTELHIEGIRSLYILDNTSFKMSRTSQLSCYKGSVRSGGQSNKINACEAVIVKLNGSIAKKRYNRLVGVDHPCILKALGYGRGINDHRYDSFLALEPFENSFQMYVVRRGPGIDHFGRFTEDFIVMICNIIDGIEALHRSGYYCPDLCGDSIAIIRQNDSINAKLWLFRPCNSDKEKAEDWIRLGNMICEAASCNSETTDLYNRIKRGDLKGKSILEHSAILTVRKKFKNVTTLYFHVQLNYKNVANTAAAAATEKQRAKSNTLNISDICAANLKTYLDKPMVSHPYSEK